jgi:hypothetical protein
VKLTLAQLVELAAKHGFPDPELAAAIAMAESCGNPCAQGDPNIWGSPCTGHPCVQPNGKSQSFGLWQVHIGFNPQYSATSLLDPDYNADAAFKISSSGVNWQPWSTAWEDANRRVGYLGSRAPFRPYYHSVWYGQRLVPPTETTTSGQVIVVVVALAAAAGYVASERRRFA